MLGTQNGRLFYGGEDGHLNEVNFEKNRYWFSSRSKVIKQDHDATWISSIIPAFLNFNIQFKVEDIQIDESRHLLYILLQRRSKQDEVESRINVYDLGKFGTSFEEIASIEQVELFRKAGRHDDKIKFIGRQTQIVAILPIDRTRSESIQLLVVCQSGLRLYISFPQERRIQAKEQIDPDVIQQGCPYDFRPRPNYDIACIKLPPAIVRKGYRDIRHDIEIGGVLNPVDGLSQVEKVILSGDKRLLLLSDVKGSNKSSSFVLFGTNEPELGSIRHMRPGGEARDLRELLCCIEENTEGIITDIAEQPLESKIEPDLAELVGVCTKISRTDISLPGTQRNTVSLCCMSSLTKCVHFPAIEYYVLTTHSISTYIKPRPIDNLFQAISTSGKLENWTNSFVLKYGKTETCAMLLYLMCNGNETYFIEMEEQSNNIVQKAPESVVCTAKIDEKLVLIIMEAFY